MKNLIEDVSVLTNIPEYLLKRFVSVCNYVISHGVYENCCEDKAQTTIDLGIGDLQICVTTDAVKYKFIPSKDLEKSINTTVCKKVSPLAVKLDTNLKEKIDKSYKELL